MIRIGDGMKKILIDMDDTLLEDCYIEVVNHYLKTHYTYKDCDGYWVDNLVPQEQLKEYLQYFYNQIDIYTFGHVKENAIEVIRNLSKQYEIFICSAYIDSRDLENCSKILLYKHKWLTKNLPFVNPENFIFTNRKDLIPVDVIIDDKLKNLASGKTKLLMNAYHNQNISEQELASQKIIRVHNWKEIEHLLLEN